MNHRDQARYAVATAIDTFRFKPTKVPWEPKFISRDYRPKAFTLIKTYPGYTVARKWGLGVVVKQDDGRTTSALGCFNVRSGRQDITMRVTNLAVWLHELCHAASYKLDWRIHQERYLETQPEPNAELEIEATIGAVALLYAWQLGTLSEVFWAYDFASKQAEKAGGKLVAFCEDLQPAVERQVTMILETEDG